MSVFQPLCYSDCHLFDEIHHNKASAALLTSRNEGNVLSVPPLETRPDIIGDLSSLTGVLGSAQWSLTTLCSLTHTGLHFQALLISLRSGCSWEFSALLGLHSQNRVALKMWHKAWLNLYLFYPKESNISAIFSEWKSWNTYVLEILMLPLNIPCLKQDSWRIYSAVALNRKKHCTFTNSPEG